MSEVDPSFWRAAALTFSAVFLAELGDKTQLATFAFASRTKSLSAVLLGSITALAISAVLATVLGAVLAKYVDPRWVHYGGAVLFLLIGAAMLWQGPPSQG